jgi:hypothetical protein
MRPSLIAMPPFSITRREPSIVTTGPASDDQVHRYLSALGHDRNNRRTNHEGSNNEFRDANLFIALSLGRRPAKTWRRTPSAKAL